MRPRSNVRATRACTAALALNLCLFTAAGRADNTWTSPSSGKWETPSNWSLGVAPSNDQGTVSITNAGVRTVTADTNTTAFAPDTLTVEFLSVGGPAGSTNRLHLTGVGGDPSLVVEDTLVIGTGGVVQIEGADLEVNGFLDSVLTVDGQLVLSNASMSIPSFADGVVIGDLSPGAEVRLTDGSASYFSGFETVIGNTAGAGDARLRIEGAGTTWTNDADIVMGRGGADGGELLVTDGAEINGIFAFFVGEEPGANGNSVAVTGGSSLSAISLLVGFDDDAADSMVRVSGIGSRADTDGIYLDGQASRVRVEDGAVLYSADEAVIGAAGDGNRLTVSGSGSVWSNAGSLVVGQQGVSNVLIVSTGGLVRTAGLTIGSLDGSSANLAEVTGLAAFLAAENSLTVGGQGDRGALEIRAGGNAATDDLKIGVAGDFNRMLVTGSGSEGVALVNFIVGDQTGSNNAARVEAGGHLTTAKARIGFFGGTSNRVTVTGTGSVWSNDASLVVGWSGNAGRATVADGGRVETVDILLGQEAVGSDNELVITGGLVRSTGRLRVGVNGDRNAVRVTGGGVLMTVTALVAETVLSYNDAVEVSGAGSVWQNEGNIRFGNRGRSHRLDILDGGAVRCGGLEVAPEGLSISNVVCVSESTLVVTNVLGNAVLRVDRGEVLLSNATVIADSMVMSSQTVLRGTGVLETDLLTAGRVEPGLSPGALVIEGDLDLDPGATLAFELGGFAPTTGYDVVQVSGAAQLDGDLEVRFLPPFVHLATNGSSFTLLDAASLSGAFDNAPSGARWTNTDGYGVFTVDYSGSDVVLDELQLVDRDSDGMTDLYEDTFGLNPTNAADATLDKDGDGMINRNEAVAGTAADDSNSLLRITGIAPEGTNARVWWTTSAGRQYRLEAATIAVTGIYHDVGAVIPGPASGEGKTNLVDVGGLVGFTTGWYRVRAAR